MNSTSKSLLSISLYMQLSIFSLTPTQTPHGVMALFLYSSSLLHIPLFWFFFYFTSFVPHWVFCSPPSFPFLCHSKLELIRLTSQISHRLVAHFISISAMWLHLKFSSPPHPIDLHPQPPPFPCLPLIYQTFRIGASRNLLHTRALPGNLMCCFAFSVFIRGKWVLKLVTFDLREALSFMKPYALNIAMCISTAFLLGMKGRSRLLRFAMTSRLD